MGKYKIHKIALLILSLFLSLYAFPILAAERIVSVDFMGLVKVDPSALESKISSRAGKLYSQSAVSQDIKTLFQTGYFDDVSVNKESAPGGVRLVFHVHEKGTIGAIKFKGNKKVKGKDLLDVVTIREFNPLDPERIAESEQAITKLYLEKNLPLAEVSHELVPLDTENNEYEIIFNIQENKGIKIKRISFVGNKAFSDRQLTRQMKTKVKGFLSFISSSGKLDEEKLQLDTDLLTYFYLNHGFLKVKIGKPQISLTRNKKALYVTIPVYEGSSYKISRVDVAGDIITTREEILSKIKLKAGDTYSRVVQDQDIAMLTGIYGDQAYAFASIYPDIRANDVDKTAEVIYTIEEGPKITIERIDIKGNTITHDKVIRRELKVTENAPYHQSNLDLSKRRLMQLGYFEEVNFSTPRGSRDDTIILVVEVKEKPTGTFSIGAGFSSLESFIFNASIQKDNFFGLGLRGGVMANISKLRQEFALNISDRYFLDTRWIFSGSVHRYFSALNQDFDQKSLGGTVSFGREIFRFFDASVGYNIDDISITNFSAQVPAFFQDDASGLTSSIITSLAYDTRDNRLFTSKGMLHSVTGEYAGNGVGGSNDFWKMNTDSRFFFRLPLKSILKTRGYFAYVNSTGDSPVPLFERFFLGGINTLRGFDLNTVGPRLRVPSTATGGDQFFTYGGNRMLLFNVELEMPIYDPAGLKWVLFVDAGQAFAEDEKIDLFSLRSNYGFGLRWNSPFGPLRFEWGFPFDKREGESFSVFNFTIGQSF